MVFLKERPFRPLASLLNFTVVCLALGSAPASKADPTVSLSVSPIRINEGSTATYTLTASTVDPNQAMIVNFSMRGKAVLGKHYVLDASSSQVTIPAGAASASVTLTSLNAGLSKGSKTATMVLKAGSAYSLSSSNKTSVTIVNSPASPTPTPTPTPNPTPTPSATPIPTPTQEIWIAVRTDGLTGTGTQADPFDGSTPERFDAVMRSFFFTPNVAIHLTGLGPFRTYHNHNWLVRSGWVISGDGMYSTTVQIVGNVAGMRDVVVFRSDPNVTTDYVTISDLTIDCNWAELSTTADTGSGGEKNIKTAAVLVWGSNNLLERIRCINSYGSLANKLEQFAIFLSGPRSGDGTNNIIRECRAELPQGTCGNPFALAGWVNSPPWHLIVNSKVVSCTAVGANDGLTNGFTSGGVNMANVKNCEIDGNTFIDCFGAAYLDVGSIDGLRVTNNTVVRGWQGVGVATLSLPRQNIEITGNNFLIQNRVPGGASYGILVGWGTTNNLMISSNTISFDTSGGGMPGFWGVAASLLTNATVSDNTIGLPDCRLDNVATGSAVTMFNNRTPEGTLIPDLNNQ